MEYIYELVEYTKVHPYLSAVIGILIITVIILLYVFRQTKTVIDIVGNAIVETEKACNTEKGQEKLDMAVAMIKEKLPRILSIFITKSMLVSIIEFMLNFIGKAFKVEKKVDIIGNDFKEEK